MERKLSTGVSATPHVPTQSQSGDSIRGGEPEPPIGRGHWWDWYEPGTSKAERWLIFKLDCFILWYTCLSFFVKYLDQTAVTNAYITGMDKDLHLDGGDYLNWLTTYYNIGIIVGGPFVTFGLTMVAPRYWLPGSTLIMSLFVLFMYKAENVVTLYGLRFCAGLFASGIMPGSYYIIGSWYRKSEIARRSGIFTVSSIAGGMMSSYIQAGLATGINGRAGLAAWRWLFIFDAIISIPVAIFGIFTCPNEPRSKKMWWMTEEEQAIAIDRISSEGRDSRGKLDWTIFRRTFASWQFYLFPLAYMIKEFTCGTEMMRWMALYLKRKGYDEVQRNAIPTAVECAEIVFIIIAAAMADRTQKPAFIIVIFGLVQIYGYAVFIAFPKNDAWLISTYIVTGAGYSAIGPIVNSWLNTSCGGDKHLRALATALVTVLGYVAETIGQQVFFPVSNAPTFKPTRGYVWGISWAIVEIFWSGALIPLCIAWFSSRGLNRRRALLEASSDDDDAISGSSAAGGHALLTEKSSGRAANPRVLL